MNKDSINRTLSRVSAIFMIGSFLLACLLGAALWTLYDQAKYVVKTCGEYRYRKDVPDTKRLDHDGDGRPCQDTDYPDDPKN